MGTEPVAPGPRRAWGAVVGALVVLVVTVALAGCSKSPEPDAAPSTTVPPPACKQMPGPRYPDTQRTLTAAETAHVWCLHVGDRLAVQLTAPNGDTTNLWEPVHSSDRTLLAPDSGNPITPPRGETTTFLRARKPGEVTLQSKDQDKEWRVLVVISR